MTTTTLRLVLIILVTGIIISCDSMLNTVKGEGPVVSKEVPLADFHEIKVSSGWEVELIPDPQPRMIIHTEENLLDMVEYKIERGKLHITHQGSVGNSKSRLIQVFFRQLDNISADSNAEIFSSAIFEQNYMNIEASTNGKINLKLWTDYCKVKTSASGIVNLEGTTNDFKVSASTSSRVNAKELKAESCNAVATSSGYISIYVTESLNAETETGGKVDYFGNPSFKNFKYNQSDEGIRSNDRTRTGEESNSNDEDTKDRRSSKPRSNRRN
ncbi:MAG TPA: head GIN domain-containing protein [Flavobacteriaceae bacterium]|nr:head GIN domain-containing protein [Flavobacteriaceae bacterium]